MASKNKHGFTIVELLIVIVVIGILAAITIVAYNGIQTRAKAATLSSDLANAAKQLALFEADKGRYPTDLTEANLKGSAGTSFQLTSGSTYCLTATNGTMSYNLSSTSQKPVAGSCFAHGLGGVAAITNLIKNPSLESNLNGWAFHSLINGTRVQNNGKWTAVGTRNAAGATAIYAGRTDLSDVTSGSVYTASATVTSTNAQDIRIEVRNNTSSTASFTPTTYPVAANTPMRISTTGTVTDSTVHVTIWWQNGAIGDSVTVDEVSLVAGSTNYPYADGNSTNWAWAGTQNNSISAGPPQ